MTNKIFDVDVKRIRWFEKILLLFVKHKYVCDSDGNVITTIKYKKMFNRIYVLKNKVSVKKINF